MKQRYDSYKPSGIDWIGEIPSHWKRVRLKHIGESRNGLTYSPSDIKSIGKLVIRSSNIQDSKLDFEDCVYVTDFPSVLSIKSGDTIICSRNGSVKLIGKSVYIYKDTDMTFGAFMMRFRPNQEPKFTHYLLNHTISHYKGLFATTTINQLTADAIHQMETVLPPLAEQEAIAAWLDEKCREIDAAIAKVHREIELIDELKQSEISRVVTRGLNPDVPLRPSGIDWIGDVPEHWEKCRFKNFMYLKVTPSVAETKVGLENLEPGSGKYIETDTEFEGNGIAFTFGDILYGKLRPYLRKVWLAEFEGNAVGDFFVFRNHNNSNITFIKYLLLSDGFTKQTDGSTFGAKMPRVSSEFILTLPYFLPPLSEQQMIADYLDKKCSEIDGLKEKLIKKRETLKELRKAIISEVVTGKRKVI